MGYVFGFLILAGIAALLYSHFNDKKATGAGGVRPGDPKPPSPNL